MIGVEQPILYGTQPLKSLPDAAHSTPTALISATAKQSTGNHREGWKLPGQTPLSRLSHTRCICLQMNHQDGVHSLHIKQARWAVELVKAGARCQSLHLEPSLVPTGDWQTLNRTL